MNCSALPLRNGEAILLCHWLQHGAESLACLGLSFLWVQWEVRVCSEAFMHVQVITQ